MENFDNDNEQQESEQELNFDELFGTLESMVNAGLSNIKSQSESKYSTKELATKLTTRVGTTEAERKAMFCIGSMSVAQLITLAVVEETLDKLIELTSMLTLHPEEIVSGPYTEFVDNMKKAREIIIDSGEIPHVFGDYHSTELGKIVNSMDHFSENKEDEE